MEMWEYVYFTQDDEGRERSELFESLPDRKEYPEYYKVGLCSHVRQLQNILPVALCGLVPLS